MIPEELHKYFWDVSPEELDPARHKRYVIERLLELGDENAVRWLFGQFSRDEIREVLSRSRQISAKSRSYWELLLNT